MNNAIYENKHRNLAKNSFILIFVQCVTLCCSLIQTMVLSRTLTKYEYGTYSQGILIISLATTFVGFGANNAVNYFYNKTEDFADRKAYINTIFFLELVIGTLGALVIVLSGSLIANFFKNYQLSILVFSIALRPLFANIILMYQTLYISCQMAKEIAVRNLLVSLCQVTITSLVSLLSHNVMLIFMLLSFLDLLQILFFSGYFRKKVFAIHFFCFNAKLIRPIFSYAIPMALSLMLGTLLTNLDSLFIGKLMSTEELALYANMSKELPFSFIGSIFTTVITPTIINLLGSNQKKEFCRVWSNYIQLGYMTTWTLCFGAISCAPELLRFLYSSKYISGLNVFIVYILIQMFRFTYFGVVLTATGRTKTILVYTVFSLALNFVLNLVLFKIMGMTGCAIASLISIALVGCLQLYHSSKIVNIPLNIIINTKKIVLFLIQMFVFTVICLTVKGLINRFIQNDVLIIILVYGLFLSLFVAFNRKSLRQVIHNLDI